MPMGLETYGCAFGARRLSRRSVAAAGWETPAGWSWSSVVDPDEDALTLALAAARALHPTKHPDAIGLASMSLPYRRRVQGGLLATALGAPNGVFLSEHTTSPRSGTEALLIHAQHQDADGHGALVVAAEDGLGAWNEVDQSATGVAFWLAPNGQAATVEATASAVSEDPGLNFIEAGADVRRDVHVPDYATAAYVDSVQDAAGRLCTGLDTHASDFDTVILAGIGPSLARKAAAALGLEPQQWTDVLPYSLAGDTGAAAGLLGLAAALDAATPGDRILLLSHGSGSATDAVALVAGPAAGRGAVNAASQTMRDCDLTTFIRLRGGR